MRLEAKIRLTYLFLPRVPSGLAHSRYFARVCLIGERAMNTFSQVGDHECFLSLTYTALDNEPSHRMHLILQIPSVAQNLSSWTSQGMIG